MKVTTDATRLVDHTTQAFVDAVADTLLDARDMAPRRTGEYAASLRVLAIGPGTPLRGKAASSVPRASGIRPEGGSVAAIKLSIPKDAEHLVAVIGSTLPQAGAVERGAFVGHRRGPHMRGTSGRLAESGAHFGAHFIAHLREGS